MYFYKLSSEQPLSRNNVLKYFSKYFREEPSGVEGESYLCIDGSILTLHQSSKEEGVYVEFHCKLVPDSKKKAVLFESIAWFCNFCSINQTNVKSLRNNTIIPPSPGAIFSDLKGSRVFKQASHIAESKN